VRAGTLDDSPPAELFDLVLANITIATLLQLKAALAVQLRPGGLAVLSGVLAERADELLVFEGRDDVKGETYYRPLGGGIEFGETAADALRREFREELAAELTNVVLLDVLENIFTVFGRPGHEIVFVFEAELADRSWYEREDLGMVLDEGSPVSWRPLREFAGRDLILYPAGLAELLLRKSAEV